MHSNINIIIIRSYIYSFNIIVYNVYASCCWLLLTLPEAVTETIYQANSDSLPVTYIHNDFMSSMQECHCIYSLGAQGNLSRRIHSCLSLLVPFIVNLRVATEDREAFKFFFKD